MRLLRSLALAALVAGAILIAVFAWPRGPRTDNAAARGGHLVSAIRAEPRSFNRFVARDRASLLVSHLLHGRLVQLNHATQEIEPALAERWDASPDGRTYVLHLRRGVTFSDGAPFSADDVAFTFAALYDATLASPLADSFRIDGKPIGVETIDSYTVRVSLPAPYAPGLRILSGLPMLPARRLKPALDAGTLRQAWGVNTAPGEIAGLGPFVLKRYVPGDRVELERNPRYWRTDAGKALPALDRLTLRVVPDTSTELLRLEAGELDLLNSEVRPEDIAAVRRLAVANRARILDVGISIDADSLWFNLSGGNDRARLDARPWMHPDFRRAVSLAVDRTQFVNTVLLGAGIPLYGPVTPGHGRWHAADLPKDAYDPAQARSLLASLGLTDRNGDGIVEIKGGRAFRIELLTQKGHAVRERASSVLKEDLAKIGLRVDVASLDVPALIERLTKGEYDAAYFAPSLSDTDPSTNLDYWLSSGAFHIWNPRQKAPATEWERQIDSLMRDVTSLNDPAERKRRFDEVQRIFAAQRPAIFFAAARVTLATSARVQNVQAGVLYPHVLWRADTLAVAGGGGGTSP